MLYEYPNEVRKRNLRRMEFIRRTTYVCGIKMSEPNHWNRLIHLHAYVIILMSLCSVYGHVCFISHYKSSIYRITESLCTCLQVTISIIKLYVWIFIEQRFHNLVTITAGSELFNKVTILDKDFEATKKLRIKVINIIEECWNKAQRQIRFYVSSCIIIISFYFFNALITNSYHQIKGHQNVSMKFAYSTRFPGLEDAKQHLPFYAIITIVDGYACFAAGMVAATFDGYFAYLAFHGVSLVKSLKEMILYTSSTNVSKENKLFYLRECIQHYNRTIRFCDEINDMYSIVNICQLLISLIVLGVVLFQLEVGLENSPKDFVHMILYISAAGCELFIYCFDGQNLATETENLDQAWYSSNWYDESREFKLIIYMMMVRCSRTYYISASGFTTMSRPTFLTILKTSGSYFMLLRNLTSL